LKGRQGVGKRRQNGKRRVCGIVVVSVGGFEELVRRK